MCFPALHFEKAVGYAKQLLALEVCFVVLFSLPLRSAKTAYKVDDSLSTFRNPWQTSKDLLSHLWLPGSVQRVLQRLSLLGPGLASPKCSVAV